MKSAVNLPNHTFTGQAWSSKRLTSIMHILTPETDNYPSWISGRETVDRPVCKCYECEYSISSFLQGTKYYWQTYAEWTRLLRYQVKYLILHTGKISYCTLIAETSFPAFLTLGQACQCNLKFLGIFDCFNLPVANAVFSDYTCWFYNH